ncbi:MAG: ATP-binding protein [Granulosicoccus sp.]
MRRLGISLLVAVLISIIVAGWAIDKLFITLDAPDQTLETAAVIGKQLANQLDKADILATPTSLNENTLGYEFVLSEKDEIVLPDALNVLLESGERLTLESEQNIALYFLLPETQKILSIAIPKVANTQLRLLLTLLFYAAIAFLLLLWLYPLVRRLHRLARAAGRFGEGELDQRISTHKRSQLYDIESEFNKMAQRIQDLVGDNKLLSSAVSHDLKTPLARLRFGIDSLSEQISEPKQTSYLERISDDLTQMEELVDVLLEFAKLDQRLSDIPLGEVSLQELAAECIETHQVHGQHQFLLNVSVTIPNVIGESRYIQMMLNNILSNALKFAQTQIHISIEHRRGSVHLQVEDDGPGFEGDAPMQWLKPFAKSDPRAASLPVQSHGMGLAIVHRIALCHDIEIHLDRSKNLGGACVKLVFRTHS